MRKSTAAAYVAVQRSTLLKVYISFTGTIIAYQHPHCENEVVLSEEQLHPPVRSCRLLPYQRPARTVRRQQHVEYFLSRCTTTTMTLKVNIY